MLDDAEPTGAILTDVLGFREVGARGLARPLSGARCGARRHRRHPRAPRASCPGRHGRRLGAPHRLPRGGRRRAGRDGARARREPRHPHRRSRWTATTSARSTSASPAASSSRSPPTTPALPPTSRSRRLGQALEAAALPRAAPRARSRPCCRSSAERRTRRPGQPRSGCPGPQPTFAPCFTRSPVRPSPAEAEVASMDHATTELSFIHRFEPATEPDAPPLLLLHGTGGDENDLLPLGRDVSPGSALLSPRGKVLENGMPRFFRRLAEGVFDEDGRAPPRERACRLRRRGARGLWARGADRGRLLERRQHRRRAAACCVPRRSPAPRCCGPWCRCRPAAAADLAGKPVLILSGAVDPIVPADNAARLAAQLARRRRRGHAPRSAGRPRAVAGGRHAREGVAGGAEKLRRGAAGIALPTLPPFGERTELGAKPRAGEGLSTIARQRRQPLTFAGSNAGLVSRPRRERAPSKRGQELASPRSLSSIHRFPSSRPRTPTDSSGDSKPAPEAPGGAAGHGRTTSPRLRREAKSGRSRERGERPSTDRTSASAAPHLRRRYKSGGSLRGFAGKPYPRKRGEEIGVPTILSFIHRFRSCRPTTPPPSSGGNFEARTQAPPRCFRSWANHLSRLRGEARTRGEAPSGEGQSLRAPAVEIPLARSPRIESGGTLRGLAAKPSPQAGRGDRSSPRSSPSDRLDRRSLSVGSGFSLREPRNDGT